MFPQHLLSVDDLTRENIEHILSQAERMKQDYEKNCLIDHLRGKIVKILFEQPSTRTVTSFEAAVVALGGYPSIERKPSQESSLAKGESIADMMHVLNGYCNIGAFVSRHPSQDFVYEMATYSNRSVINAGNGKDEHPTQTLTDLFTIYRHFGRIDNINIALVGDLKYGRTVHSLVRLAAILDHWQISLVSPNELTMPDEYLRNINLENCLFYDSFTGKKAQYILSWADIIYMTRPQREHFAGNDIEKDEQLTQYFNNFTFQPEFLDLLKDDAIVLHPLPRNDELPKTIDLDPHVKCFEQSANGGPVRMAVLDMTINNLS
jgi:aspartate carbamoyltransferase catalytic subunit